MRLPFFNGDRKQMASAADRALTSTIGHDQAGYTGGIEQYLAGGPDVNPALMGREKFYVYREMKMSDPAVRSLSWMYKLPIRSAEWGLVPAEDDPEGEAVARARTDFAAWQFGLERHKIGRLDLTWDELLQQDLLYLDYGCMGGEDVWGDLETWVDLDGDSHNVRPLNRIAPRFPHTIEEIDHDSASGRIGRVLQESDKPGEQWIPGTKLSWLTLEREGDNWWGSSALRSAYGAWLIKKELIVTGALAFDRFAMGIPEVRHPRGGEKRAAQIGRDVRAHERGYVTFEGVPVSEGGTGSDWALNIVSGASSIADPVTFLRYLDGQTAAAGLQHFSQLGTTTTGSRAVGEVLVEPFYQAVMSVAKQVAQERMRSTLRRLWDRNFGEHIPIPEIVVSRIEGRNIIVLARALADLNSAGLSFTDRDTQNDIRDQLQIRHLPEAVQGPVADALASLPADVGVAATDGLGAIAAPAEGGSVLATAA